MKNLFWALFLAFVASSPSSAAESTPNKEDVTKSIQKGYEFLKSKQDADGSFLARRSGPGVTALVAAALLRAGYPVDDPVVRKALQYLEKNIQKDGGVYNRFLANYTTSLAVLAFQSTGNKKYEPIIKNAVKFLRSVQEGQGTDEKELKFGGAGYDAKSRPDTSNTGFFVEALMAAGVGKDDPAMKNAIAFLSRAQNLPGEFNDQPFAQKVTENDKGGFVYNPFDQSAEKSDKRTPNGGLRSEGGMTYVGLKSFLYAGVAKDDPRVKAAVTWIKKHYTLKENPGVGTAGLFYYYHVFAKAMDALGEENFEDAKNVKHAWKIELFDTLKALQAKDGSWVNKNPAFLEGSPELATTFAILSLSYCLK